MIFLTVLVGYFIFSAVAAPLSDYANYYFGSIALLQGDYQLVYDMYSLNALIVAKGFDGVFACYTPFPPFTSIILAPFLVFPVVASKIIFNIVQFTAILVRLFAATYKN